MSLTARLLLWAAMMCFVVAGVKAHEVRQPNGTVVNYTNWANKNNQGCCNNQDCKPIPAGYERTNNGRLSLCARRRESQGSSRMVPCHGAPLPLARQCSRRLRFPLLHLARIGRYSVQPTALLPTPSNGVTHGQRRLVNLQILTSFVPQDQMSASGPKQT
jgi:hypothetical protein